MSCMTILFLYLQIIRSDIRPQIKLAVSLVIAYDHFNLPQGFVWVNIGLLTFSPPRDTANVHTRITQMIVLSHLETFLSVQIMSIHSGE